MKLEPHELKSPLWLKLQAHMESELALLRERNDQDLDPIKTATLRGKASAVKAFLLLAEPPGDTEPDDAE